jgi:hypothetical protein
VRSNTRVKQKSPGRLPRYLPHQDSQRPGCVLIGARRIGAQHRVAFEYGREERLEHGATIRMGSAYRLVFMPLQLPMPKAIVKAVASGPSGLDPLLGKVGSRYRVRSRYLRLQLATRKRQIQALIPPPRDDERYAQTLIYVCSRLPAELRLPVIRSADTSPATVRTMIW